MTRTLRLGGNRIADIFRGIGLRERRQVLRT
jgi:hypothetical protein